MPAWLMPAVIILLYLAALGHQSLSLLGKRDDNRLLVLTLGGAALLLHAWHLHQAIWAPAAGVNLSFLLVVELTAWLLSFVITLSATRLSVIVLIPVAYLMAITGLVLSMTLAGSSAAAKITQPNAALTLHIILALASYILLLCTTLYSVMLRSVDRHLKRHEFKSLPQSMPPLMTMETHLFQLLFAGWLLLTLTLATGVSQLYDLLAQHQAHKLFFTLLAWGLYGGLLFGHWRLGWRGRRVQTWLYSGFVMLTLGYFGSRFVLSFLLDVPQA